MRVVTVVQRLRATVIIAATAGAVGVGAQQAGSFRASVDLISLPVTVTGPGGRYASDLTADDFEILEDGRPQDLAFFSRATTALSVSLLVDSSSSMEERMLLAKRAAMEFVAKLRPNDDAEVVDFDSRVMVVQPFTRDRARLTAAIESLRAGGSTALYNAVYITLRQFDKSRPQGGDEPTRHVIVLLSDGEDTASLVTFDELLDVAKRSQAVIYAIGLGFQDSNGVNAAAEAAEFALRRLAQETGGRLFTPKRPEDLTGVYAQVADELTNQYILGYLSRNDRHDGRFRTVAVRVKRPQLQARTRPGYYAAKP